VCGIAGFRTLDKGKPSLSKTELKNLFLSLESRGKDSAGVYFSGMSHDFIYKQPGPAKSLIIPWDKVLASNICFLHARHATQGNPKDNSNNHPLVSGDLVLTHNGVIYNSDDFVSRNLCDSWSILEAYQDKGNMVEALKELRGSMTFAFHDRKKDTVILCKIKNPLWLTRRENTLIWGSTKEIISSVKSDYIWTIPENTLLVIQGDKITQCEVETKTEIITYTYLGKEVTHETNFDWLSDIA